MGAKAPDKLKLQRPACKCEVCGRKFPNVPSLRIHRKTCTIKNKIVAGKRVSFKKQTATKQAKKTPNQTINSKSDEMSTPKSKNASKSNNRLAEAEKLSPAKKIEFQCPKCSKIFNVYFSAYRHIQKYHCVDSNDQEVEPQSPDLIKPIRIEWCLQCSKFIPISEPHACRDLPEQSKERLMCLGCQKTFENLLLFEDHVKKHHMQLAEYYFFPNQAEFTAWKTELETGTQLTFTGKYNSKQIYHCPHEQSISITTDKKLLCPSSIRVNEYKNGLQVIYYNNHYGHICPEYKQTKYKKYLINTFLHDTEAGVLVDKENPYQLFKTVMENITVNTSKIDSTMHSILLGKAMELAVYLNALLQEDVESIINKSLSEKEIIDVLAEVKTYPGKRKATDSMKNNIKRTKIPIENDENSKNNNTADVNKSKVKKTGVVANKITARKDSDSISSSQTSSTFLQSPSFNDTYKEFVDQNFKKTTSVNASTPKSIKKKPVVKTKIGQFKAKPSLSPSPTKPSPNSGKQSPKPLRFKIKPDIKYEVKERENDCNILILKI